MDLFEFLDKNGSTNCSNTWGKYVKPIGLHDHYKNKHIKHTENFTTKNMKIFR